MPSLSSKVLLRRTYLSYHFCKNKFALPCVSFLISRQISCWKCGKQHNDGSRCSACNASQEPSKLNYFELFGVNVSYDINVKNLIPGYHRLQILFHPDKHSNEDENSRKKSEEFSTAVNKAYSTLMNPIKRALYILELNGVFIDETTSSQNPELFMLILHYNDEISNIKHLEDARNILNQVEDELQKLSSLASDSFNKRDYEAAKDIVIKMKYYENVLKSLKAKIREKGFDM